MNALASEIWSRATPPGTVGTSDQFWVPGNFHHPTARFGVPEIGTYLGLWSGAPESEADVHRSIYQGALLVLIDYAGRSHGAETTFNILTPSRQSGRRTKETEIVRTLLLRQRASGRLGTRAVPARQAAAIINDSVTWAGSAALTSLGTHGATTAPEGGWEPLGWPVLEPISPVSADDEAGTLARFQGMLAAWKGRLFTGTFERLGRQLPYLLDDEEELAALSHTADAASFAALLSYLAVRPWIKAPSLTLTRNGIFVANWRPAAEAKARLSVEFTDEKRVRWSAVDVRNAKSSTMTGGICSVSDLDEHLRCYRSWFCL